MKLNITLLALPILLVFLPSCHGGWWNPSSWIHKAKTKVDSSVKKIFHSKPETKTAITSPFSNRGQLGNIYTINLRSDQDLIMKTAELADFAYSVDIEDKESETLGNFKTGKNTNNRAKHLNPYSIKVFEKSSVGKEYTTVGFVAKIHKDIGEICVISFRGSTQTNKDWHANLNIAEGVEEMWPYKNDYYKPFYEKAKLASNVIYQKTRSCKHFIFTGHSQGAAVASISAIELKNRIKSRKSDATVSIVNFASPRPGDGDIVKKAKELDYIFSIENEGDIVVTIPPYGLGFEHLTYSSKIKCGRWRKKCELVETRSWENKGGNLFSRGAWKSRFNTWKGKEITHSMGQYIKLLDEIFYR